MDIRWRLYIYAVVNCALCVAKPVSLNEVIAAESQQKQLVHTASPKLEEPAAERFSIKKSLKYLLRAPKKFKETESIIPLGKQISALKYRKTFQVKSPLRPKRIKPSFNRHKRKNLSVKREIGGNEKLNQKYIPLLRNLGMLFDNLLSESSESAQPRNKRKRVRYYTDTSEILCPCSSKSNARLKSEEAADTSAETISDEASSVPETTTETPYPTAANNFRGFRQNKNIPVLLPRNTSSSRRDYNGFSARSRPAHYGSAEGYISRDHGDSELGTGDGSQDSNAENDEENTNDDSRYDASSIGHRGGIRNKHTTHDTRAYAERNGEKDAIEKTSTASESESTLERPRGNLDKPKREDKQQIRNDKAESAEFLSANIGKLRGFVPANKVDIPESKLKESKKSNVEQDYSSDQRLADGSSAFAEENKETSTGHETVEQNNIPTVPTESFKTGSAVFIIDGYSVTRSKNGENKLKEKAIHIHSK